MKILVISHSCATAANQRLYEVLAGQTGWEITLVIPQDWRDEFGNRLRETPVTGIRVLPVPVRLNGNIILHFYRRNWRKFLERENFDVVYVNQEAYGLATWQVMRANRQQIRPAAFGFYSCQNLRKNYPWPFSAMERQVYRESRFAFPITDAVAGVLLDKGFAGNNVVLPLPVDLELCHPLAASVKEEIVPRAGGEVVLGFVGRLVEVKGLRTLAAALERLGDLRWKMIFVGTGELLRELMERFHGEEWRGRFEFRGYVPHRETPQILAALDVLILPSESQANWEEQFGRVLVEAWACGTCVVGSNSGEIPRLIEQSQGGLVFEQREAEGLAAVLREVIGSPQRREELAERGRRWVETGLGLEAVAKRMAQTFREACAHE